jgi:hypothetical protein
MGSNCSTCLGTNGITQNEISLSKNSESDSISGSRSLKQEPVDRSYKQIDHLKKGNNENLSTNQNKNKATRDIETSERENMMAQIHPALIEAAQDKKKHGKTKLSKRESVFFKPTEKDNDKITKLLFKVSSE